MPVLDVSNLGTLQPEELRALVSVEMGMKNHDHVTLQLIASISGIKHGSIAHTVNELLRLKLLSHIGAPINGYALTHTGYDYLAINSLRKRGVITALGSRIGVGKEADVYMAQGPEGESLVIKLHKLGRVSFRTARTKRDYLGTRKYASWMYLSRLAALREFGFMAALYDRGLPVPKPISLNRHCVCMSFIEGVPMHSLREVTPEDATAIAQDLHTQMVRMLELGVVHGDCNEYNSIVDLDGRVAIIDFPQMIQATDPEASMQFDRDVDSFETFFRRRFGIDLRLPRFSEITVQKTDEQVLATEKFAREMATAHAQDLSDEEDDSEVEPARTQVARQRNMAQELRRERKHAADREAQRRRFHKGEQKRAYRME